MEIERILTPSLTHRQVIDQQIPSPAKDRAAEMWNTHNDNDILVFALLWEPLGGPTPENVATAFSI